MTTFINLRTIFKWSEKRKRNTLQVTEGKNQTLVGPIPFCGEYPGSRFEDKFRSANQIDGISIADGGKMADIFKFVICKQENMRNTVLHVQTKVHPVIASISVKFRGMKEDIDISKR